MSGVFGHAFGRKKSLTGGFVISSKYSVSSYFVLRQAKYVYDCENPAWASQYMIFGLVKASARKITSGWCFLTVRITQCQKGKGLVWGLSTRKIRTPLSIQNRKMPQSSFQRSDH